MIDRSDLVGGNDGVDLFRKQDIDIGCTDTSGADDVQDAGAGHAVGSSNQKDPTVVKLVGILPADRIMGEKGFFIHRSIIQPEIGISSPYLVRWENKE